MRLWPPSRHGMLRAAPRQRAGVPWIAREKRAESRRNGLLPRLALAALLTLTLDAVATGAERSGTHATRTAVPVASAPADLRSVSSWVTYKQAAHLPSLPTEARLFYRRGLMAKQAGQEDQALLNVRGAAELDPAFVAPHLTLASWMLVRDPSQALQEYGTALADMRQDFGLQLSLAANFFILLFQALFAGLTLTALFVVWTRRNELLHPVREALGRFGSPAGARWWSLALLVLPFCVGFGLTLPAIGLLGLLWPVARVRERALFVTLTVFALTTPLALGLLERLALPMYEQAGPYYGVPTLENAGWSPQRQARLVQISEQNPDNALVQFGLAWVARRGGDLTVAEQAYRRTLQLWPDDSRTLNNLGNVLAMQGRAAEALAAYEKSVASDPTNAAALFNASQIHTQRFEYAQASDALNRANALNFELVKRYQSQATSDGLLPLADVWLAPSLFWKALKEAPTPRDLHGSLPTGLRDRHEASGWPFSVAALLLACAGVWTGLTQARRLPLRACSNCGTVVCRRCAERRREHALCPACARVEAEAETHEFSRVLLLRQRNQLLRRERLARTALAALLPGYGIVSHRHVFRPVLLIAVTYVLVRCAFGYVMPFSLEPRLMLPGQEVPVAAVIGGLLFVYASSLLGYLHLHSREEARQAALNSGLRGRITQSTRRSTANAA
ncbi:MAG: tetratricopeptide repeat protein [Candidatus Eisenbacteria bacterium]|uniref:Tetratricopeptide repeat protein n=1 Tax=Eiseniibacteriota bacterium TaxID=2212470 RepID=A0A933SFE0_UNCEI|nr:tetratricopeptide repeat protein [Candidatus Eisenbacteria bacterium]